MGYPAVFHKEGSQVSLIKNPPQKGYPLEAGSGAVAEGMVQKILSIDKDTGDVTRLLRFPPGAETDEVITHDFCEEVIILEGELHDKRLDKTFTKYVCLPPTRHEARSLHDFDRVPDVRDPVLSDIMRQLIDPPSQPVT